MAAYDHCLESLGAITVLWQTLLAARQPGTAQPSSNAPPGIEQARSLRAERVEVGSAGGSVKVYAAPCDLTVVITITDVELMLAVAHDQIMSIQGLPRACSRCQHALELHGRQNGARCAGCRECAGFRLNRVAADARSWKRLLVDERAAIAVQSRLETARKQVETTLNLVQTGALLMAPCPWCRGVNDAMPTGSLTLRAFTPGAAPETYVMCLNPSCDPSPEVCGYRTEGRPYWPFEELGWLAIQLQTPPRDGVLVVSRTA